MCVAEAAHPRTSDGGPIPHASSMPMPRRQVVAAAGLRCVDKFCLCFGGLGFGIARLLQVGTRKVDCFGTGAETGKTADEEMVHQTWCDAWYMNNVKSVLRL